MKRMFSFFLALALLAVLSGCGKQEPTPSRPDEPTPPPEEGITLAELNVEFVAGGRDTDALMQLKKELPPLLIGALADEGVTVGRVNVTFGASDEATADALARGSVQVGFMPMETYLAHEDTLRLVSVPEEPAGDTERVGLYFPVSDQNRTLRAAFEKDAAGGGALHAWETLLGSFWMGNGSDPVFAVPVDDDVARRFLDSMMDMNANGMMADSIPRLTEYVSADEVFSTADLVVLHGEAPDEALWMEIYGCTVGGETVSVSTADAIVGGDEFAAALLAALEKLSADETAQTVLRLYDGDGVRYGGADTQAVEFVQCTGCGSLAVAVGNAHGAYVQTPNLDFDRIASLRSALPIPLVLHGCSDIPPEQLQESVRLGMSKFNIATEYFRACYHGVVQHGDPAEKNGDMFRLMMETSENAIDFVRGKMRLLNPNKFTF